MCRVVKVWLTDTAVWVEREDGEQACELFADYPRLRGATPQERAVYQVSATGIHWEALDEDLGFEGFFRAKERTELYRFFMGHPELNASAIARRLGISQSLLAQYINGQKRPSVERTEQIKDALRKLGAELLAV